MLDAKPAERDEIVNEIKLPAKSETRLVGALRPKRGHKTFKFIDGKLLELQPEDYEDNEALDVGHGIIGGMRASIRRQKVKVEDGAKYVTALNYKNALKKLIKHGLIQPIQ